MFVEARNLANGVAGGRDVLHCRLGYTYADHAIALLKSGMHMATFLGLGRFFFLSFLGFPGFFSWYRVSRQAGSQASKLVSSLQDGGRCHLTIDCSHQRSTLLPGEQSRCA